MNYEPKAKFIERIKLLLKDEEEVKRFFEVSKTIPKKAIRVNTLKITPRDLIKRLENKNWEIVQPFSDYPEILIINNDLEPGELGKTKEHILGYYYIQEITSMMPILMLNPNSNEILLDLCAAPGSKTTQAAALMENKGNIIANDVSIPRISILSANLEKNEVMNTIITRHDGLEFCSKLRKSKTQIRFDKILVDAPCSGEGNIRTSPRTYLEWSEGLLENFGKKQKKLASAALELLKINGEMVYSTCTYAPEENEEVIQHVLDNYDIEIVPVSFPIKTRTGILKWKEKKFDKSMANACRIYHHDNNLEGFFLCKIKKLSEGRKNENIIIKG